MNALAITESKKLGNVISNEYAIQCIQDLPKKANETIHLMFRLLIKKGQNFNLLYTEAEIPKYYRGIIIGIDIKGQDYPKQYWVKQNYEISFAGGLRKICHYKEGYIKKPEFVEVFHYSGQNFETQKLNTSIPEWLKNFAKEKNANVAYFEF